MRILAQFILLVFPWFVRRRALVVLFGFDIHPNSRIGLSIVAPKALTMAKGSSIGHLNVAKGLDVIELGVSARIGNLNWITGFPGGGERYFKDNLRRRSALCIQEHGAIQNRNYIDCTDRVTVGRFSRVAGIWHQFLTHGINLATTNQASAPILIGEHCFIGTGAMILKGGELPDFSVLAAGSVLHKKQIATHKLYSGTPALPVKDLDPDLAFFRKVKGDSD